MKQLKDRILDDNFTSHTLDRVDLCILLAVIVASVLAMMIGTASERVLTVFFISLIAVVGMGVYSGNSGILSFGHLSFMAIGAYAALLLTLPAQLKVATLPKLPEWLATAAAFAMPAVAETLTIGLATAQTGGLAGYDGPVIEGLHIAVDETNAAGSIDGHIMIELIEKDVRSDAAQTAIAVQELADAGVSVIVLPCDADPALAAIGTIASAQIPAISTCASSPTLPMIGGDFMFANFPGDNVQATVAASWAHEQGFENGYIIYSPDSQYTTMPLYFADVFKALGGTMLGQDTHSIGQQDFFAIAPRIAAHNPQPDVIMAAFNAKYEAATGNASETVFNAVGYDLVTVVAAAVTAAGGSTDPVAIRDAMANLENGRGATSLITYKGTNGMPVREVTLIRVKDGARELVGQPSPDAALIPAPRMQ